MITKDKNKFCSVKKIQHSCQYINIRKRTAIVSKNGIANCQKCQETAIVSEKKLPLYHWQYQISPRASPRPYRATLPYLCLFHFFNFFTFFTFLGTLYLPIYINNILIPYPLNLFIKHPSPSSYPPHYMRKSVKNEICEIKNAPTKLHICYPFFVSINPRP